MSLNLTAEVFSGPVGGVRIGEGALQDLSVGGCLLSLRGQLKTGSTYRLSLAWQEGRLDLPCRVARDAGVIGDGAERRYALEFNLTYDQEKALMRLLDLLRRTAKPTKGFMDSYWE